MNQRKIQESLSKDYDAEIKRHEDLDKEIAALRIKNKKLKQDLTDAEAKLQKTKHECTTIENFYKYLSNMLDEKELNIKKILAEFDKLLPCLSNHEIEKIEDLIQKILLDNSLNTTNDDTQKISTLSPK